MVSTKLNQLWRLGATALCFFCFGVGGAFFTFLFFPTVSFFVKSRKKRERIAQKTIQYAFRLFLNILKTSRALQIEIEDLVELENESGCIVVANHPTLLDYVLITAFLPRCICIVKQEMWSNPFARGAVRAAGYIANTDTQDMLARCDAKLKEGNVLLIFPEGTRTPPGEKITLKRGAAHIAVRSGSAVRLIHIQCNPSFLFKGDKWYKVPRKCPKITIKVGERFEAKTYGEQSASEAVAARKLNDYMQSAFVALSSARS